MSETFKCCNCGFVCEIINSESLDMGIAECEKCGMKGLRRQNVSFVDSFRKVITMLDPQANSLMSKDMPPPVKILADWGRKACDELDKANEENKRLREVVGHSLALEHYLKYIGPLPEGDHWGKFFQAVDELRKYDKQALKESDDGIQKPGKLEI